MFQKVPGYMYVVPEDYEFDCGSETYVIVYENRVYKLFGKCILTRYSNVSARTVLYINKDRYNIDHLTENDILGNAPDLERIVDDFNRLITEQYEIDGVKFKEVEEKFRLL